MLGRRNSRRFVLVGEPAHGAQGSVFTPVGPLRDTGHPPTVAGPVGPNGVLHVCTWPEAGPAGPGPARRRAVFTLTVTDATDSSFVTA